MDDVSDVPSADMQEAPAIPAESGERPRRRPARPVAPKSRQLPSTEAGEKAADQGRQKLIEMVDAAAAMVAKRRRATALDETDYEAGFDMIVAPAKHLAIVAIVADAAGAIGSGLIGYSTSIFTGATPDHVRGGLAIGSGALFVLISIILKWVRYTK